MTYIGASQPNLDVNITEFVGRGVLDKVSQMLVFAAERGKMYLDRNQENTGGTKNSSSRRNTTGVVCKV